MIGLVVCKSEDDIGGINEVERSFGMRETCAKMAEAQVTRGKTRCSNAHSIWVFPNVNLRKRDIVLNGLP